MNSNFCSVPKWGTYSLTCTSAKVEFLTAFAFVSNKQGKKGSSLAFHRVFCLRGLNICGDDMSL